MRLGDLLIRQDVLTEEKLKKALELQKGTGKKIGEVLVENGFITEEMIARALQTQLGLKMIELTGVTIPKEVRNLVSVNLLKKYQCIPFELDPYNANILHLAMSDPMDMAAIDDISIVTNLQVEPYIATPRDILAAIDRCYGASETMDAARRFTREREQLRGNTEETAAEADVSDAPIVQLVRSLIEQAVRQRASDIHIEALETKVRVRYRIDGALYEKMVYDNSLLPAISTRIKIMGGMDISEKRKPQDGRITIEVDRKEYDIRVSNLPTVYGEKCVMRLAYKEGFKRNKADLGMRPEDLEKFDNILKNPHGIILVTGPTGSGKSTLVNLIPRFYDVTSGDITLDGVDIREVKQHELREKLGYVPQKGVLFSGDIASNIMFGNSHGSDDEMIEAAEIAQATEFIDTKPEKYKSPISQGGSNVSGGQKQRLSIARAIAKHPQVFIFDDSFSALDYKTDVTLRRALAEKTSGSTVLIVAQRISTILHAEQIIVLDEGKVAGKGTHAELLKNCPVYREIAESQLSRKELEAALNEQTDGKEDQIHG